MMSTLRKCSVVCTILFACVAMHSVLSLAASTRASHGELDPAIKREVEKDLIVLAEEVKRKAPLDSEAVLVLLTDFISKRPHIYGAAFAFAPQKKGGKLIKSSPYVYRSGDQLSKKDLIESYDYTAPSQKWYVVPVKQKKPVWSEPYYDEGGGEAWMITYSIPIYASGKHPRLIGVVTSDVLIPKE